MLWIFRQIVDEMFAQVIVFCIVTTMYLLQLSFHFVVCYYGCLPAFVSFLSIYWILQLDKQTQKRSKECLRSKILHYRHFFRYIYDMNQVPLMNNCEFSLNSFGISSRHTIKCYFIYLLFANNYKQMWYNLSFKSIMVLVPLWFFCHQATAICAKNQISKNGMQIIHAKN